MEKPDLFESEGDDRALSWLADMQPASAAALKPDFLYRAGYEAAQIELLNKLRRRMVIGSAALLLLALGAGSLAYELGSQHGQALAARHFNADDAGPAREQRAAIGRRDVEDEVTTEGTNESATADPPAPSAVAKADQTLAASAPEQTPAISRWWQSQLRQYFAGAATHPDRAADQFDLGPNGADWDDLVERALEGRRAVSLVTKPRAPRSSGPKPNVKEAPTDTPALRLRGSLLPLRESQIQTLMNELL